MALAYYTSYQLPVIITRGNNVYGPGQFPEKLSECDCGSSPGGGSCCAAGLSVGILLSNLRLY